MDQLEKELDTIEDEKNALATELENLKNKVNKLESEKLELSKLLRDSTLNVKEENAKYNMNRVVREI